jgi:hypothetical protein
VSASVARLSRGRRWPLWLLVACGRMPPPGRALKSQVAAPASSACALSSLSSMTVSWRDALSHLTASIVWTPFRYSNFCQLYRFLMNTGTITSGDRFSENRRTLQCANATSATCLSEARPTRCKMHPACGHHLPSTPALTGECTELHRHGHPLPCRAHHPWVTSRNPSKHTEA